MARKKNMNVHIFSSLHSEIYEFECRMKEFSPCSLVCSFDRMEFLLFSPCGTEMTLRFFFSSTPWHIIWFSFAIFFVVVSLCNLGAWVGGIKSNWLYRQSIWTMKKLSNSNELDNFVWLWIEDISITAICFHLSELCESVRFECAKSNPFIR